MEEYVCTACSLLCDDVKVAVKNGEVSSLGLCKLGHDHLATAINTAEETPLIREEGLEQSIPIDEALQKAAQMLSSAKRPLLFGWSCSTNEVIEEGIALARILKGVFDSSVSLSLQPAMSSTLHSGKLDFTLDDVREKAETVVYWGCNPVESNHRHASRFAVLPRGEKIPEGVESRTVAVVDIRETETMKMANHRLIIKPGADVHVMQALSDEISKTKPISEDIAGVSAIELIGFARSIGKSDCTVFFYGDGLINSGNALDNLALLSALIDTIRALGNEAYALPMPVESNSMGVYQAQQNSKQNAIQMLLDGESEAVLIVGEDSLALLPGNLAKSMVAIPIIYIGPSGTTTAKKAKISMPTADNGVATSGTMLRMDLKEVVLNPLRSVKIELPSELELIKKLHQFVKIQIQNSI